MINFQKIKKLILQSNLSLVDQTELIKAFSFAKDSDLEDVLKLFSENSSWIEYINKNYKAKRSAFITGNSAILKNIFEEEKKQLKEFEE